MLVAGATTKIHALYPLRTDSVAPSKQNAWCHLLFQTFVWDPYTPTPSCSWLERVCASQLPQQLRTAAILNTLSKDPSVRLGPHLIVVAARVHDSHIMVLVFVPLYDFYHFLGRAQPNYQGVFVTRTSCFRNGHQLHEGLLQTCWLV